MLTYLAIISLLSLVYAYLGYPLILSFLDQNNNEPELKASREPETISLIIAARNERASIEKKIQDTLKLHFKGGTVGEELLRDHPRVQVIVADDASDDGSIELLEKFSAQKVQVSSLSERGGKERAQKRLWSLLQAKLSFSLTRKSKYQLMRWITSSATLAIQV